MFMRFGSGGGWLEMEACVVSVGGGEMGKCSILKYNINSCRMCGG